MHHDWLVKRAFANLSIRLVGNSKPFSINVFLIESVGGSEQGYRRFFAACDASLTSHIAADLFKVRSLLHWKPLSTRGYPVRSWTQCFFSETDRLDSQQFSL